MSYREWKVFVEDQKASISSGCIMIQADDLQLELVEFLDKTMEILRMMLLNSARKESIQLLNKVNNVIW